MKIINRTVLVAALIASIGNNKAFGMHLVEEAYGEGTTAHVRPPFTRDGSVITTIGNVHISIEGNILTFFQNGQSLNVDFEESGPITLNVDGDLNITHPPERGINMSMFSLINVTGSVNIVSQTFLPLPLTTLTFNPAPPFVHTPSPFVPPLPFDIAAYMPPQLNTAGHVGFLDGGNVTLNPAGRFGFLGGGDITLHAAGYVDFLGGGNVMPSLTDTRDYGRAMEIHRYSTALVSHAGRSMRLNEALTATLETRMRGISLESIDSVFEKLDAKIENMTHLSRSRAKVAIRQNSEEADARILSLVYTFLTQNHSDEIDQWLAAYIDESLNAYGKDRGSCVRGVLERVLTSLRGTTDSELDALFTQAETPLMLKRFEASLNVGIVDRAQAIAHILRTEFGITAASSPDDAAEAFVRYIEQHYATYGQAPDAVTLATHSDLMKEYFNSLVAVHLAEGGTVTAGAGGGRATIQDRDNALQDLREHLSYLEETHVQTNFQRLIDEWIARSVNNSVLGRMVREYMGINAEVFASQILRLKQDHAAGVALEMDEMRAGEVLTDEERTDLEARPAERAAAQQAATKAMHAAAMKAAWNKK